MFDAEHRTAFRSGAGWDWALSRSEIYHRLWLREKDTQPVGHRASALSRSGEALRNRVGIYRTRSSLNGYYSEFRDVVWNSCEPLLRMCYSGKWGGCGIEGITRAQFLHNARAELLAPKCGQTAKDSA